MKLLYTCADSATDPLLWSGTVSNCRQALLAAGVEVEVLDEVSFDCPAWLRVLHQCHKRFGDKVHYLQIEPLVLRRSANRIAEHFERGDCDAVFCPGVGVPVYAFLPPSVPVITYLDASKRSWIRAYFGLNSLCERSRRHVDEVDRTGFDHHTLTVFSSRWAEAEAARDYSVSAERTAVVPFGANLADAPERTEVVRWINTRRREPLRLLFLGKEWERKGGPEALSLVRALRARGLPATLDIVGCDPVLPTEDRAVVRLHGFLDHGTEAGAERFRTLLRESHILLFLSRAEAYGIALCEAAAYGVPAFATDIGGVSTIVQHDVNGWLAASPFCPFNAATVLAAAWRSPDQYRRIALAARLDYEQRLNWQVAGRSLRTHLERALARREVEAA